MTAITRSPREVLTTLPGTATGAAAAEPRGVHAGGGGGDPTRGQRPSSDDGGGRRGATRSPA